jgi:hypothetical protein
MIFGLTGENGYTATFTYNDAGSRLKMHLSHNGTTQLTRLDVYPNPSKGTFFVNTGQNESYRLRIYDSKANLIFDRQYEGIAAIDFGTENLSRGLYILRAELPGEVLSTKLIYLP